MADECGVPRPTILVIEDEPPIVQIIRAFLLLEGYHVVTAIDGIEGIMKYVETRPDLITLDVMMPRLDGLTVLKWIRDVDKLTPIIMLTAMGGEDDVARGYLGGCSAYVTFPFDPAELVKRIKHALSTLPAPVAEKVETRLKREGELLARMEFHCLGHLDELGRIVDIERKWIAPGNEISVSSRATYMESCRYAVSDLLTVSGSDRGATHKPGPIQEQPRRTGTYPRVYAGEH